MSVRLARRRFSSVSTVLRKRRRRSAWLGACSRRWMPVVCSSTRGPTSSMTRSRSDRKSRCSSPGRSLKLTDCGGLALSPDRSLSALSARNLARRAFKSALTWRSAACARASRNDFHSSMTAQSVPGPTPGAAEIFDTASTEKRTSSCMDSCARAKAPKARATARSSACASGLRSSPSAAASSSARSETSHCMYVARASTSDGLSTA
mmetsp:Transcript_10727/g.35665  ORF Transcript_10727/g.35665 Transcript_10727/m.35665 type:complete len:207 (+) Transcript_10727:189-809(+)